LALSGRAKSIGAFEETLQLRYRRGTVFLQEKAAAAEANCMAAMVFAHQD